MPAPGVNGCSPELASGREVIRRNTTLLMETSISSDRKQRAVTPDIGAVAGDIERKITEYFHAKVARQGTELAPLTIEMPLKKILLKQVFLMSATPLLQCRIAVDRQLVWPGPPRQPGTGPG